MLEYIKDKLVLVNEYIQSIGLVQTEVAMAAGVVNLVASVFGAGFIAGITGVVVIALVVKIFTQVFLMARESIGTTWAEDS